MAVTESVKIVFEVDDKALVSTVQQLQAVGKVSQEDAAKFNALTAASKAAGSSLEGASKGAEKFAVASKDIAKSTNEVAKSTSELKNVAPSIGEAGVQANIASEDFVSLRERLREAKLEVQRLGEQFNNSGPEFEAAVARAGELADEFDDLNRQVRLSNPEGKIQAFQNLGQGIVGAFSVATGALQAFGAENEQVQQIAQKLQGALNIAQGIQSIVGLKEAYDDVKVVLGFTTAAQNTLTTATTAGAAATGTAATATRGFAAALTSTGIGAIVVAIGALAGAFLLLSDNESKAKEEADKLIEKQKELTAETEKTIRAEEDLAIAKDPSKKAEIEKARAIREGSSALREQQAELNKLNKQINNNEALNKDAEARIKSLSTSTRVAAREATAIQIQSLQEAINRRNEENQSLIISRDLTKATIFQIKDRVSATKSLIDEENKATGAAENYNDAIDDRINKERAAFEEARKVRQFSVELNKLYGATEEEILQQKIFNNQVDQEALNAILKKAEGTQQYEQVQSQLNDAVREEIFLRKQLENQLEIQKIALKGIETQQGKTNDKAKEAVPVAKEVSKEWQGSASELIASEDARIERQKNFGKVARELARETSDFIFDLQRQRFEDEQTELDKQREAGLITEEQYQEKVLQLRKRQAQADKNAAIFGATVGLAEAIIKALNAPPPVSFQAVALASALAAANLAKIIATPLPKFKQGTLSVPGRDTGDDSVMAMLRPDEAVIPTETNREFRKSIRAIFRRSVDSKELNEFVENKEAQAVMKAIYSRKTTAKELNEFISNRESNKSKQDELITDKDIQHIIESVLIKNKQSNLSKYSEVINDKSIQSIVRSFYLQKFTSDELSEIVKNKKFNLNNFDELINTQTIKSIIKSEIVNNNKSNISKYNEIVNNKDIQSIVKMLYARKSTLKELSEFINNKRLNLTEYNELINDRDVQTIMRSIYSRKSTSKELNEFVESRKALKTVQQINDKTKTVKLNNVELEEPIFKFNPVTLDAMFKRDLRVSQINSAVQRSSGGAIPTINVKADVDTYALSKAMAKNKTMEVGNVESIGEAVAEALSKRTNRRQQI